MLGLGPALNSNFRKAMNVTHLYGRLQSEDQKDTCPISVQHSKCRGAAYRKPLSRLLGLPPQSSALRTAVQAHKAPNLLGSFPAGLALSLQLGRRLDMRSLRQYPVCQVLPALGNHPSLLCPPFCCPREGLPGHPLLPTRSAAES